MEEFDRNEFQEERSSAKMYLDTFTFDLYNSFESSADKEIERLINEIDKLNQKHNDLDKSQTKEKTEQEMMNIEIDKHYCLIDIEYIKEEIWALIEMKILYEFKFLEINIKKLIRTTFSGTKTNDFYKWDLLIAFLRSRNIKPKNLKGFLEISQLKDVNNTLKHSGEFPEELKNKIPEFKKKRIVSFYDLDAFYSRIKNFPKIYLADLASAFQTELYEFNDQKIDRIANNIARRMEKKDVDLLINAIKSRY
ncbi:hypothetical protein ACT3CD_17060 [Geofilum sp. OHC36d9]|uniref:hypothetical protein n=1 Tax=Geofilum sp. OHC36d9 TaxID=3458413 RepID=UPI004034CA86